MSYTADKVIILKLTEQLDALNAKMTGSNGVSKPSPRTPNAWLSPGDSAAARTPRLGVEGVGVALPPVGMVPASAVKALEERLRASQAYADICVCCCLLRSPVLDA